MPHPLVGICRLGITADDGAQLNFSVAFLIAVVRRSVRRYAVIGW